MIPPAESREHQYDKRLHDHRTRESRVVRRSSTRAAVGFGRNQSEIGRADAQCRRPGQDEGPAPAKPLGYRPGHDGRERHPEIAPQSVDANGTADALGMADQHRSPNRMIDRGKEPHRRKPKRELPGRLAEAGRDRGETDAEEEHRHHVAPAPAVAQPSGRQGSGAEHDETAQRERDQLAIRLGEIGLHAEHRGREDQHDHMIDQMADIDKTDHSGPRGHNASDRQLATDAFK